MGGTLFNSICWGSLAAIVGIAWFNSESKLKRWIARAFIAFVIFGFVCNLVVILGIGK